MKKTFLFFLILGCLFGQVGLCPPALAGPIQTLIDDASDGGTVTNTAGLHGGGSARRAGLTACRFLSNTANGGGGLSVINGGLSLTNVLLAQNSAGFLGGEAIYVENLPAGLTHVTIAKASRGSGSGIFVSNAAILNTAHSPAIGAGDNLGITTDLDGPPASTAVSTSAPTSSGPVPTCPLLSGRAFNLSTKIDSNSTLVLINN